MLRRHINFEWYVGESEYDSWASSSLMAGSVDGDTGAARREQLLTRWILRGSALILVMLIASAGLSLSELQLQRERAFENISFVIGQENKSWAIKDRAFFNRLVDPTVPDSWLRQWRPAIQPDREPQGEYWVDLLDIEPTGQYVRAWVRGSHPYVEWSQTNPYVETRYYIETDQGWLRTLPPPEFWGETQLLVGTHMRFHYREGDAAVVQEAAAILDRAYSRFHIWFDIEPDPTATLEIIVIPDQTGRWPWAGNQMYITSPSLTPKPEGVSEAGYMAEQILNRVIYRAISSGDISRGPYLARWPVMNWGLRRYIVRYLLEQPSPWHEEAAEVLYRNSIGQTPLRLPDSFRFSSSTRPSREQVIWRFMAAESVAEYATQTYGAEQLPQLVRALSRYSSWTDLAPALYGLSMEEFAEGWNDYLRLYYGVGE
jgi:hypothetical protein